MTQQTAQHSPAPQWTDTKVIDYLVSYMAIPEWPGADMLEGISEALSWVRPHPGGYEDHADYAPVFKAATGRELPPDPTA